MKIGRSIVIPHELSEALLVVSIAAPLLQPRPRVPFAVLRLQFILGHFLYSFHRLFDFDVVTKGDLGRERNKLT